jgi:hypothetical protein
LLSTGEVTNAVEWFNEQLDAQPGDSARYPNLRAAIPKGKIRSLEMWLMRIPPTVTARPDHKARQGGRQRMFGAEVALTSESLRLNGRADLIRRAEDAVIEIVDFKTGDLRSVDGEIKTAYALQLQAYALMFEEQFGASSLRLILNNGREELVPSDREALGEARERIAAFVERFPAGSRLSTKSVASPGSGCGTCRLRPGCLAYMEAAPNWWPDVPAEIAPEPPDTWGELVKVIDSEPGRTLLLVDAARRHVQVSRIDADHPVTPRDLGKTCWLFNLRADSIRRGFSGQRPHPRLFHELPRDPTERRAWDIAVYV